MKFSLLLQVASVVDHAGVEVERLACGVEMVLVGGPLAALQSRGKLDRAAAVHVVDAVDARH